MTDAPPLRFLFGAPVQRRAWRRYWVRDVVRGWSVLVLHSLFKALPIDVASAIGAAMASAIAPWDRARCLRTRASIVRLRPDLVDRAPAMERRLWANTGRVLAEVSLTPRLWRSSRIQVDGLEHVEAARATGRPRIYVSLHVGDWELLGPYLIRLGENVKHTFLPQPNRFRRRIAAEARGEFADHLEPPGPTGLRRILRHLSDGRGVLVMFLDETVSGKVQAPALGRSVRQEGNISTVARLARKTDAVILPAAMLRARGASFRLWIGAPTGLEGEADLQADVARLDALVEPIALDHLDQWVMLPELRFEDSPLP